MLLTYFRLTDHDIYEFRTNIVVCMHQRSSTRTGVRALPPTDLESMQTDVMNLRPSNESGRKRSAPAHTTTHSDEVAEMAEMPPTHG